MSVSISRESGSSRRARVLDVLLVAVACLVALAALRPDPVARMMMDHADWEQVRQSEFVLGPTEARRVLVEFVDYRCPACFAAEGVLSQFDPQHASKLRRVIRHLPLTTIHPGADTAAFAAACAHRQGMFPAMHKVLMDNQAMIASASWADLASLAGIRDSVQFASCLRSDWARDRVAQDVMLARRIGVTSTPSLILDREWLREGGSPSSLRIRLLAELR